MTQENDAPLSLSLPFAGWWVVTKPGLSPRRAGHLDVPVVFGGGAIVTTLFSTRPSPLVLAAQLGAHDFIHEHPLY